MKKRQNCLKKILSIILIIFTFLPFNISTVKAQNITQANLYAKEKLYCIKYKGVLCRTEFVVYENDEGKQYPAYCLNRELEGVSVEHGGYTVQIENEITNELIWRAIINGYPYKTYQELGCNNEMEAFTATKMAVYDMMYNYNWDDFVPQNETGERVLKAIKNIAYIARNSTQTRVKSMIEILPQSNEWQIDEIYNTFVYKKFKINANTEMSNYIVEVNDNIKIVDEENIEKNVFSNGEDFKILVPIDQLNENKQIEIKAVANLKTYPIYYGKAPGNLQNYALCTNEYETVQTSYLEEIDKNETTIKIFKVDGDTKEPLKDCIFTITKKDDKNNKISAITDEKGTIIIQKLVPGEYIVKEDKSVDGYINNNEEQNVKINLNETKEIIVENYKIVQEQPKEKVKLPKTGF